MTNHNVLGVGLAGKTLSDLERRILDETTPYSVILFARNVGTAEQVSELVREIKSYGDRPPLVVIDEEGGRVDRLRELIPGIPGAAETASTDDAEAFAGRLGELIGQALRSLDIDVNLAPVVDVERNEPVKGLERRTWGKDPARVASLAGAFLRGQQRAGVGSCLKHFPGLGAGYGDPHYGASVVNVPAEELEAVDLAPYRALADEAGAVMIGHSVYPAIEDPDLPASLSRRISTGLLREVLEFEGVSLSDDMEMHAVSDLGTFEEIGARALLAGSDVVYFCAQIERVPSIIEHFSQMRDRDPSFEARYEQALARAESFRRRCEALKDIAETPAGFDEVKSTFARFCRDFEEACGTRVTEESSGTGTTGREEWT